MKITTKFGDKGCSKLFNGEKLEKNSAIFSALGDLDELNSFLGWCRSLIDSVDKNDFVVLEKIQDDLYKIMAIVGNKGSIPKNFSGLDEKDVVFLEEEILKNEKLTRGLDRFVKPGVNEISSRFHIARTVCRRSERSYVDYSNNFDCEDVIKKYLNRLSDLLFVFAYKYSSVS